MNSVALDVALRFTLSAEGGFVDNPADVGGATNKGITQTVYDHYRVAHGELPQSVALISAPETHGIYASEYWAPARCDLLSLPLAVCHFDWAVNHGVTGAIRTLQTVLAVKEDGICGPITREAMLECEAEPQMPLIDDYLGLRSDWYRERAIADPSQREFLDGWLHRDGALREYVEGLA